MQRLEVSGTVRPLYGSLGVKGSIHHFHLRSTRAAPVTAWKLKVTVGATRGAVFQKHGSVVGCPPSIRRSDVLQQQRCLLGHFLARSVSL